MAELNLCLKRLRELPLAEDIWIETADTNDAKALSNLVKKLRKTLREGLEKKSGVLRNKAVRRASSCVYA